MNTGPAAGYLVREDGGGGCWRTHSLDLHRQACSILPPTAEVTAQPFVQEASWQGDHVVPLLRREAQSLLTQE